MMAALVLGYRDVTDLLDMEGLVPRMAGALRALSRGEATMPPRQVMAHPGQEGLIAWMPAVLGGLEPFGSKVISVYPKNRLRGLHTHQGAVLLFAADTGEVRAIVDADALTARRTAAVSALATDLLAPRDAAELTLLGSGTQAETHLEAMLSVRPVVRVRVHSRSLKHAEEFARRMGERFGIAVEALADARAAVEGADIVCTLTEARAPVLEGLWLKPGVHVNAVGASVRGYRELDDEAVRRARLYVDSIPHALAQADDILLPLAAGVIPQGHILGEIGGVAGGEVAGRASLDDLTLFKSVGLAVEDLAAAAYCLERAQALGRGTPVDMGAGR